MEAALDDAGVRPAEVDALIADGSGIPQDDRAEAEAVRALWSPADKTALTALKPLTGHLGYASAAVEAAAGVMCLAEEWFPPLPNFSAFAPGCEMPVTLSGGRRPSCLLMNTSGFGGQKSSLVFRRFS
jgi:3-oxoacyl-(acyl-carrier-protein) synthase